MTTNSASQYFNDNWQRYQQTIRSNTLYHLEMAEVLNTLLIKQFGSREFSFVDVGCGDASTIVSVLKGKPINHYIGIDDAADVLKMAEANLSELNGKKEFISNNMVDAIKKIPSGVDVIFTSYALHHLSLQQKKDFILECYNKLNKQGVFLMIDGILREGQTRDEWLDELENRIKTTQSPTPEELDFRMKHPRKDDFPEMVSTFQKVAAEQGWGRFEQLLLKDIYVFLMFVKG